MNKKSRLFFCSALLLVQVFPFSLVFAETIDYTPTSESTISSTRKDPLETINTQKTAQTEEESKKVLTYEDQAFWEHTQPDSSIPAILLEIKQLDEEVCFQGKVVAGSEVNQDTHSNTKLNAFILQRSQEAGQWQDHHVFTVDESGVNLTVEEYLFDFTETITESGTYRYRLAADYIVETFEANQLIGSAEYKGSLELGSIERMQDSEPAVNEPAAVPAEVPSKEVEEPATSEPVVPSESLTPEKQLEATSSSESKKQEVAPLAEDPLLPKLQEDYKHAFQRGIGIMPLASNNASYTTRFAGNTPELPGARIEVPVITEAKYTSKTTVAVTFRVDWIYNGSPRYTWNETPTQADIQQRVANTNYSVWLEDGSNYWRADNVVGAINQNHFTLKSAGTKITSFTNTSRSISSTTAAYGSGTYSNKYAVCNNTSVITLANVPVGQELAFRVRVYNNSLTSGGVAARAMADNFITFVAPNLIDLAGVSTPSFTAINENTTTVNMAQGTYTGDVLDNVGGTLDLATTGGFSQHYNNMAHTNTRNGTYSARQVSGLTAGTEYTARVGLKDVFNVWKYSGNSVFRTPNSVNQPGVPTLNTPTTSNNATAAFTATYNVGPKPAHPTNSAANVRVQASFNNSTWFNATITGVSINSANRQVAYTITGMAPNTTYYIRYGVKNTSNAWSPWSASRSFTTNGVALGVSTPIVNQGAATPAQITMNAGTYTGNTSINTADRNTGIVRVYDGSSWVNKTAGLGHGITLNGSYNGYTITGLAAGSTYQLQVGLKNAARAYQYSTSRVFYTPNVANKPSPTALSPPTTATNATATFTATYSAGVTPAHPSGSNVRVWVSENGGPYTAASLAATPVVTTGSKQVSFTVKDLKAKTNYKVKYSVLNASTVWSNEAESDSFTTRGIALTIQRPTFDQASASESSITMNQGSYTGDITPTTNDGRIEVTGNNGTDTDIMASDLAHTVTTNGTYESKQLTGLVPGTRYQGTVAIKNFEGSFVYASLPSKWSEYFYTTNKVNQPDVPILGSPSNMFTAKADFTANYEAGDTTGKYTPAHPAELEVEISTDDATWTAATSSSSPKLASRQLISSTKTAAFSLEELRASTTYYVRYRVKNNGGWSAWSDSRQFVTLSPPAGLYIMDFPTFDFGMLGRAATNQTASLSSSSVKSHVVVDNSITTVGWSLTAKLEPLKRITDARPLPWAALKMDINLQQTTDGGTSWNNYTNGVIGVPRTVTLPSGGTAQTLWQITNPSDAQGTFRNQIDWNSVELEVPGGNLEGRYQGKLVWSLNSVP